MAIYTVYLGTTPIFCGGGTEYAYEVYAKTKELAELIGETVSLVWDETGEVVADFDPNEWEV